MDLELGKRPPDPSPRADRYNRMNRMGGELSETLTGFPSAFQTDLPVSPEECGGPVCNLKGQAIGLNIARAGRIKTYAIPGSTIAELLKSYDFAGQAVAATEKPKTPKTEPAPKPDPAPAAKPVPAKDPLADLRREVEASIKAVAEARRALERAEKASQGAAAALKALEK